MPPLPQRPVRPVNRAGPKPQPPSQSRQLMVVESCLKGEAKNFDDGSTGAGAGVGSGSGSGVDGAERCASIVAARRRQLWYWAWLGGCGLGPAARLTGRCGRGGT